jgi:hypothetical protein
LQRQHGVAGVVELLLELIDFAVGADHRLRARGVALDEGRHRLADHPLDEAPHAQERLANLLEILVSMTFHGVSLLRLNAEPATEKKEGRPPRKGVSPTRGRLRK